MCTNINQDYGVSIGGIPPMLAVPLAGPVKITVKDLNGKLFGETTANPQGQWRETFCLDDGTYIVEFTGFFRPIGSGFKSVYATPVTSVSITIAVPITDTPATVAPDPNIGPLGPAGAVGAVGASGVPGVVGPSGPIGANGPSGVPGSIGPLGVPGPSGVAGPSGPAGAVGSGGPQGIQGLVGPAGQRGFTGNQGVVGATGVTPALTNNRVRYMFIADPTATDSFPIGFEEAAVIIDTVYSETDMGTVDFDIEHRSFSSANVSGTSILTTNATADEYGDIRTNVDFSYPNIPITSWLVYVASAVSGGPTGIWLAISYTIV